MTASLTQLKANKRNSDDYKIRCFASKLAVNAKIISLCFIIISSCLSYSRRQAIIWINVGILPFRPLGTKFSEISIKTDIFSLKKMHLKTFVKCWPFCLSLNVLTHPAPIMIGWDSWRQLWKFHGCMPVLINIPNDHPYITRHHTPDWNHQGEGFGIWFS